MPELLTPGLVLGENEKFLIYGEFGTGKTHLALSAPDPIWAIGVGGMNEFKTRYSKPFLKNVGQRTVYIDSVKEERVNQGQMTDNPVGWDRFCDTIDEGLEFFDKENIKIATLVVDNATVLEEYIMNKAIAAEFATASNQQNTTLKKEREWGIRKPGDNTYGGAQSLMSRAVGWMFELPFHIVFVAHEHKEWSKPAPGSRDKEILAYRPLFVGQQRINIPNMFDNVWRTTVSGGGRNRQFEVQSVGDDKIAAKTRVGGILQPALERNVNLTDVIEAFKKHANSLTDND